jgi:hypothetical protein
VQNHLNVSILNESFSSISGDTNALKKIYDYLKVERPGAYFEPAVKAGFKSPFEYYSSFASKEKNELIVMNGHLSLLKNFGVNISAEKDHSSIIKKEKIDEFLLDVKQQLPFEPRDYQEIAFKESLLAGKQINKMCTSSGKSLTISLIAEFFRREGKKGLLLVPNINLLTQFKNDIKDYNLNDLYNDTHVIGGGSTDKHFDCTLTISTWQSMQRWHTELNSLDYVICDELHRFASQETSAIVKNTTSCKYKWGFTGTLPEDPCMKMVLFGLFGLPKTYITSSELIERGLATPIEINAITFKYSNSDKALFQGCGKTYPKQLQFLKEHETRNKFIINLMKRLKDRGNTLTLFQHTQHGKDLFTGIMSVLFPDVQIENKNITGKKSFEFQEQYGVYFLNGEDDAKTRELTRKILEEDYFNITLENDQVISLNGNTEVKLIDGSSKLVKELTEDDEIDDEYIHTITNK